MAAAAALEYTAENLLEFHLDGNVGALEWVIQPFAEGGCRKCFKGTVTSGKYRGKSIVAKVFKDRNHRQYFDLHHDDRVISEKTRSYADKFNAEVKPSKKILVLIPLIRKVTIVHMNGSLVVDNFVFIEPYIPGKFVKFNDNCGGISPVGTLMPVFSHWTYHISSGQELVCDLQGFRYENAYIITDPAIHSAGAKQLNLTD